MIQNEHSDRSPYEPASLYAKLWVRELHDVFVPRDFEQHVLDLFAHYHTQAVDVRYIPLMCSANCIGISRFARDGEKSDLTQATVRART